jgi:serine/threonine-protein kinase
VPLPVPPDLEEALAQVPSARAQFDRLPPQGKDEWIAWVARARLGGARRRRINTMLRTLGAPVAPRAQQVQEVEEPPPLPPGTEWWPWILALALALLVAALLVWLLVYRGGGNGSSAVVIQKGRVPNFVGERLPQAQRQAAQADVRLLVTRRVAEHPKGTIVDQKPVPGTLAKSGAPVTVVISRGPPKKAVPDVTGLAAPDAAARLQKAGFVPKLVQVRSTKTAGTVLSQKPAPSAKAAPGSKVTLTVAKGAPGQTTSTATTATTATTVTTTTVQTTTRAQTTPPPTQTQPAGVAVPSLVGKGIGTALNALERLGLVASVKYQSSSAPVGQVRAQNPSAGARVPRGTSVQVNVAEGPNPGNPTQVPDVTGEDQATASSDLQDAGFQVVVVQTNRGSGASGTVTEEQPTAGTTIASGDYVAIYVHS